VGARRVVPWEPERVFAVRAAMVERFRPMLDVGAGCGLRQGEILGLSVDDIDFDSGTLHVVQQLKLSLSKAVFAPPKGGKLRDVPLCPTLWQRRYRSTSSGSRLWKSSSRGCERTASR
jgi:integrase